MEGLTKLALRWLKGMIVTMDADCTYPGEEVPTLVRRLLQEGS